jgi:hypothetical protein
LPTTANVSRGEEEHFMLGFDIGFALRRCDAPCVTVVRGGPERAA